MQVELGTLPIYFCALYSIHNDDGNWGTKARSNIMGLFLSLPATSSPC